jgi:hypothetical protein
MFIQSLISWFKQLAEQFGKTQTYGSELESYITSRNPQDAGEVDRLMREFDIKNSGGFV